MLMGGCDRELEGLRSWVTTRESGGTEPRKHPTLMAFARRGSPNSIGTIPWEIGGSAKAKLLVLKEAAPLARLTGVVHFPLLRTLTHPATQRRPVPGENNGDIRENLVLTRRLGVDKISQRAELGR